MIVVVDATDGETSLRVSAILLAERPTAGAFVQGRTRFPVRIHCSGGRVFNCDATAWDALDKTGEFHDAANLGRRLLVNRAAIIATRRVQLQGGGDGCLLSLADGSEVEVADAEALHAEGRQRKG